MKKTTIAALVLWLAAGGSLLAEQKVPGQRPLVLIDGVFQFVPGSWARYNILDKQKNETYVLIFSILDQEEKKGKPFSWVEIEVLMKDQPRVVTRVLAEQTDQGPGEIDRAVVQVQGFDPFTVPKKYLKPDKTDDNVAQFKPAKIVKKLERQTVGPPGKKVQAWVVEAVTEDGQNIKAVVSEEILPIAIFDVESDQLRMSAQDWGLGAKTKIEGTPVPFWLWLLDQISKGLSEEKK
ncbi:MAG: hypothetical protein A2Y56_06855 [Candidatus Aminicenantes bacterium RBG_13_63_10]|nr:MAG: hypothetical protein A2Y56_06855 [Candidatus Aminicenantes bacterium RBG_13_63_10]